MWGILNQAKKEEEEQINVVLFVNEKIKGLAIWQGNGFV
jgi:hypothetical protein